MTTVILIFSNGSHIRAHNSSLQPACFTHEVTTDMSCSLELSIFSTFCIATLTPYIVLQIVLSVDVLCGKRFITPCRIVQWKGRREETEEDTALGE